MEHSLVTVNNTSITKLTPNGKHSGMDITLQNVNPSGYIYIGGENVDSTNYGYRILPNHAFSIELNGNDSLYAISTAPDMKLAVLKARLESGS